MFYSKYRTGNRSFQYGRIQSDIFNNNEIIFITFWRLEKEGWFSLIRTKFWVFGTRVTPLKYNWFPDKQCGCIQLWTCCCGRCNGFCRWEVRQRQKNTWATRARTDTEAELVLSQEYAPAPEIHRTVHHFEHKNNIFWLWLSRIGNVFDTSF